MDYGIDFIGYEYQINTDSQRRLFVFYNQILPDIYKTIQTHNHKIVALKYIRKTLKTLLDKEIFITVEMDNAIVNMIKKIAFKKVFGEKNPYKSNTLIMLGD